MTSSRRSLPWTVRLVLLLGLVLVATFVWSKRPFVSDAQKVCRVTELSGCPAVPLVFSNDCKIDWLERSMWRFGQLRVLPRGNEPGSADALRRLAREAGVTTCPEADLVEREYKDRQRRIEEERRDLAEQEVKEAAEEAGEESSAKRMTGTVTAGVPVIDGSLDPSFVVREVRTRIGAVKACYERALKRNWKLSGKVKVRWTISNAGTTSAVEIEEDALGDSEVSSCLKGLVGRWRFPAPGVGSVDVVFPFVFEAKEAAR